MALWAARTDVRRLAQRLAGKPESSRLRELLQAAKASQAEQSERLAYHESECARCGVQQVQR